jgi:hypothetical protein
LQCQRTVSGKRHGGTLLAMVCSVYSNIIFGEFQ